MAGADLTTNIAGVKFKNPVGVAAGPLTHNVQSVKKCVEAGVGSIYTKCISIIPKSQIWSRPAIWLFHKYGDPGSSTNIDEGFPSPEEGVEFVKEIRPIAQAEGAVLVANMDIGSTVEPVFTRKETLKLLQDLASALEGAGADMIEMGARCPVVMGERLGGTLETAVEVDLYLEIIKTVRSAVSIPVYVKGFVDILFGNARRFEDAGVSAHHIVTVLPGTVIDIETGRPITPFSLPYSGHGVKTYANTQTARFSLEAKVPIIISGGIMNSRDVVERLMCGATIIQAQTAGLYYGPECYTEMIDGLRSFMLRKGYGSLKDIIGIATPHINNTEEYAKFVEKRQVPRDAMTLTIDRAECVGCGECKVCCPYGAMSTEGGFRGFWSNALLFLRRLNPLSWGKAFEAMGELPLKSAWRRVWRIPKLPKSDPQICEFCGLCQSICLVNAVTVRPKE